MFKKIALSCLALVAALAASFTVVQAKSLDDIIKDGVIRIGINPNFPPNSSRGATGDWEGFDIDVGNKIAEALSVKVEWVPTETPQRVPFLVADKIDISLGRPHPQLRARQAHRVHRAAPHRSHGGAHHRQGRRQAIGRSSTTRSTRSPTCAATGRSTS